MQYLKLAELYEEISSTTKRLQKISILSKFLRFLHESDSSILYLLLGRIYPEHEDKKIGVSSQIAIKAISKSSGVESRDIVEKWKSVGDLGEVSEEVVGKRKQTTLHSKILTTEKVLENLRKLPDLVGDGTVDRKVSLITELLMSASPLEAKYIIRTVIGDLRVGIQEGTIREAIVHSFFPDDIKESSKKIQAAIDKSNDLALIFNIARKSNLERFEEISLEAGSPTKVMLAQKVKSIEEGFKALGKPVVLEYKYDGFRMLIHKKDGKISLFTRRLENVTKQFPEVREYVQEYIKGNSFILDSEVVGFDRKTKKYRPFQEISQRIRRKYEIERLQEELPVEINVFDILYYNGKSMIDEPFEKRTELIRKIVKNQPYKIVCAKQIITDSEKKAKMFYKESLLDNQEGVMMKSLNTPYQPGNRVGYMLKIKPEERDFDLVITGAEYGTGKRSGWLSSFILSCRDRNNFLEIGKVGTGIKEKISEGVSFEELTELLKPLVIKEDGKNVIITPKIVVSITYQEIQKSQSYSSGFALRFPRLTALRPDKPLSEITTLKEVEREFKNN
ncbi:MAG: ATP-dependent DNA ligase [Nanoarchaeota archaeon]